MRYKTIPLGEVANITKLAGFEFTKYISYDDTGEIIALRALNLRDGELDLSDVKRIKKSVSESLERSKLYENDILLTYTGNGYGDCAIITESNKYHLAPNICKISPFPKLIYPYFLYSYIRSKIFYSQMTNHMVGSSQPTIPMKTIRLLEVPLPPLEIQKKIVDVLYSLDEKVRLNKQINKNLERQAQALFNQLFIEGANPLWKIGMICDLGAVVGGSTPSKSKPEYYTDKGISWITPKDLSVNKSKFISHGENDITELGLKNSSATIMPEGTVLFSSRAPIGYIAIADGEVTTNQGFKSVVPKPEIGTAYVYYFLKHSLPTIEGMASGSTFKEVSGSVMKSVPAQIPDGDTLSKFNDFCGPLFAQQKQLEKENRTLAELRDTLLPKLMAGEIDVKDVNL